MNDLSPGALVALPEPSELSHIDPQSMELFNGAYFTQHAHDLFVQARTVRNEPAMRDHYHRQAMEQIELFLTSIGMRIAEIDEVKTR